VWVPTGLGGYSEINYLEVVYQQMQQNRRTSVGYPMPDYVQYMPGSCPQAEAAAKRLRTISTFLLSVDAESVRKSARSIRETAEKAATA